MTRKLLSAIVYALLTLQSAYIHAEELILRHISQPTGLPNNHITELYKDSRGFLWIGSSAGLFRYDGYATRRVAEMVGRQTGVLSEQILRIQEDADGRLWVQSESSHAIYDPETNTLIDWISDYIKEFGISGYVTATLRDENGDMWVALQNDGLYRLDTSSLKAEKAGGLPLKGVSVCSLTLSGGKIIGATSTGTLLETDPGTMKTRLLSDAPDDTDIESGHYLVYADQSKRLWITSNDRLLLFDLDKGKWQNDLLPANGFVGVVKEIYNDSKGNLWIARDHHGMERIVSDGGRYRISPVPTGGDFMPEATVSSFLEDENGTLLLGTYKLGLYSYN